MESTTSAIPADSPQFGVLHQLVASGLSALDPVALDYLVGGAESETTILRNRAAIERRALRPRALVDVSNLSVRAHIFERESRLPIFLAPVGGLHRLHTDANTAAASAASASRVPMFFSSLSEQTLAPMRASTAHDAVYQLYIQGDAIWVDERIRQVQDFGFDALCLTVDSAMYGRRERDLQRGATIPLHSEFPSRGVTHQTALCWADIDRIRSACQLPLIVKGIASADDARLAVEHGVDVVYVSNHGGRQLDHAQGALDALETIADATSSDITLFVDGGFMRGTDIIKALALGADAVGIGRLYCLAMAAVGSEGVTRMLDLLEDELTTSMALLGVESPADLGASHVLDERYVVAAPHLLSAFPLLDLTASEVAGKEDS